MQMIDRKTAVDALTKIALQVNDSKARVVARCINTIELQPTVDAVPVVRCKDCTHRKDPERCPAAGWKFALEPYDFCSYGEQKGGA